MLCCESRARERASRPEPSSQPLAGGVGHEEQAPVFAGFQVGSPIGRGGFATVWEAVELASGEAAAIKVGHADNPLTNERFRRDAEALALVGPPHAPRVFASGQLEDGRPFIAMERLRGVTLAELLEGLAGPPEIARIEKVAGAILDALSAVHAKGIIHRDLKPENIFIDEPRGRATLIDFGLVKSEAPESIELTRAGTIVGTPEYMAPEQLRGDKLLDERVDIYAFGVILYEALTLRLPFAGDIGSIEHGHLTLRPPRPKQLAEMPDALEELTLACLAKEPARRPASAMEIRAALARACARDDDGSREGAPPRSHPPKLAADGSRPMILLLAETSGGALTVSESIAMRKGFIARHRGSRYVCVFSGADSDAPARGAIAAAREIVRRPGARVALHVAGLTLRKQDTGTPAVYGAALEKPDVWLPKEAWSGVVATADFARAVPEEEIGSVAQDASFVPLPAAYTGELETLGARSSERLAITSFSGSMQMAKPPALHGRDDVLAAVEASAAGTFDGGCPGLFTLLGGSGLGKSRLTVEAAQRVARLRPDAALIVLRAEQPTAGDARPTSRELLEWIFGLRGSIERPADPRALCAAKLGEAVARDVWPAVAVTLGLAASDAPPVLPESIHPNVMRAIAAGLRRIARSRPVAVLLDDAHVADDTALDAIEYVTLNADACPIWVLVAAQPRLDALRRMWGARAERHDRAVLGPMEEAPAMQLAAELLLPAEYPPSDFLKHIVEWSGRNPACLVDLARTLKRAGIVRKHRGSGGYYIATAELERLPASTAWQWLAVKQLDALPPELSACVRLCSVLGVSFSLREVKEVEDAIDRSGGAGTPMDPGVGLRALVDWKILVPSLGERYSFQSATFHDAVYKLLDETHRREIHRHAFEVWRSRAGAPGGGRAEASKERGMSEERRLAAAPEGDGLERLARHAGACGERAAAAAAYLALAEGARARHRLMEADHHYSAALSYLSTADARSRAIGLSGRGKVRYRLHRVSDALDDLRAARAIASSLGDDGLLADVLLEEATALDHADDFAASAARVDDARPIVERLADNAVTLRFWVALGRSLWRQERVAEAIELLGQGADGARSSGDYDTRVIGLLLLSCALAVAGRVDESMARYDEVIALCAEAEDRLHLGMAYLNRVCLWLVARNERWLERGLVDLRKAIQLAREIGNPWLERAATSNMAELLHWSDGGVEGGGGSVGTVEEALALSRRSCVLVERFVERDVPVDRLLQARIQLIRGQFAEAKRLIDWIAARCPPDESLPTARAFDRMIRLVLATEGQGDPPDRELTWDTVLSQTEGGLLLEELIEILYWRSWSAVRGERWQEVLDTLDQARSPLETCPTWRPRFTVLASCVPS